MAFLREWRSFLISACLHGAALALLLLIGDLFITDAPRGQTLRGAPTLLEIGLADFVSGQTESRSKDVDAVPAPTRRVTAAKSLGENKVNESSTGANQEARLGLREGSRDQGALGRTDGIEDLRRRYLYELQVLIDRRKDYPRIAQRLGETGRVRVRFTVRRDGSIEGVEVSDGSSHPRLDSAAVDLVRGIGRYKPLPEAIAGEHLEMEVPIEYQLR